MFALHDEGAHRFADLFFSADAEIGLAGLVEGQWVQHLSAVGKSLEGQDISALVFGLCRLLLGALGPFGARSRIAARPRCHQRGQVIGPLPSLVCEVVVRIAVV